MSHGHIKVKISSYKHPHQAAALYFFAFRLTTILSFQQGEKLGIT